MTNDDRTYTQQDLAAMFHVDRHTVAQWRKWGLIYGVMVGRAWRFSQEEVDGLRQRWLDMRDAANQQRAEQTSAQWRDGYGAGGARAAAERRARREQAERDKAEHEANVDRIMAETMAKLVNGSMSDNCD